jgi:pimeloyl-ACP methyl ester carboxylesterase
MPKPRHLALPLLASYQVLLASPLIGPAALQAGSSLVRTLIRAGSGPDARWSADTLDLYASVLREPARARASAACYRTFLTRELPAAVARGDRSRELDVPALLVMGEASPLRRVLNPRPQPGVRVELIPRAGHFLPEEAPEQVLRLAGRWLARSARQAA